jgi:hypothetical protein
MIKEFAMTAVLDWFRNRFRQEATHFLYVPIPSGRAAYTDGKKADDTALQSGNHYFKLWLVQMFLQNDRNWFSSWHPAVHSAITFDFGTTSQVLTNVTSASNLKDLKADDLGNFVTRNQPLTSLLPFNGGTVTLDAGLLAMQGTSDVRDLIKAIGSVAGLLAVPQLSGAIAIAGPLAETVGSLVGVTDGKLMVGINQTFSTTGGGAEAILRAGYFAILSATAADYTANSFSVDADELKYEGEVLTGVNYLLFRIECRDTRDDWDQLASIRDPYKEALKMLQTGHVPEAEGYLRQSITAALSAPELTKNVDRRRVVTQLKAQFAQDKADLGQGAFTRKDDRLSSLMMNAMSTQEAISKPILNQKEAFQGLSW